MSFMTGAVCAACSSAVHDDKGRVVCDGCDLPTGCCLCSAPPSTTGREAAGARHRQEPGPLALGAGTVRLRLSEQILRTGCRAAPFAAPDSAMPSSALHGCRIILADSVSVYATALRSLDRRIALNRLPSLLPPAEHCFIEMRGTDGAPAWGAYLVRIDLRDDRILRKISMDRRLRSRAGAAARSARWLVLSGLMVESADDRPIGPLLLHQLYLDELGALALGADGPTSSLATSMPRLLTSRPDPEHEVFKHRCTRRYFTPIALALAFLNCEGSHLVHGRPEGGDDVRLDRLRAEPFEEILEGLTRDGCSEVEAARRIVPGRFEDDRRGPTDPGSREGIRWLPETGH